jgi:hypothetical protein
MGGKSTNNTAQQDKQEESLSRSEMVSSESVQERGPSS